MSYSQLKFLISRMGILGILLSFLFLIACTSSPEIQEFATTADPTEEIQNLERNLHKARVEQVDILSPDNFDKSNEYFEEAKEARSDNEDNQEVLEKVALGNAWLLRANDVAKSGADTIPEIVDVRARALEANAGQHVEDSLEDADEELRDIGEDFEDGDFSVDSEDRKELLDRYMNIELAAIKKENLGTAHSNIERAKDEGAEEFAPQTLALAQKRYKDAEAYITANRQDAMGIARISDEARQEAERVLRITREAKVTENKTPEQLALDIEREQRSQEQLERELTSTETELGATESALAIMSAESSQYSDQVEFDEKFKAAQAQFDKDEAEVYREGDKLVIRLKGLKFPSGDSDLTSDSYALMTKVQTVIKDMGNVEIEIRGHTDSIGPEDLNRRLSEERAQTVKSYLVQNNAVDPSSVAVNGYGDQKPITTNKTKEGRAQNRRVDIIISPL